MTANLPVGTITEAACVELDRRDPLAAYKDRFLLPQAEIYLDGNSLGALPKAVPERMRRAIEEEWGNGLIRSWNDAGWYPAPQRAGGKIARLIGAEPDEVIVCDSTSVNLFKVLVAAIRLRPGRHTIIAERTNFPTDAYVASGVAALMEVNVVYVAPDEATAAIRDAGADLAAVVLTEVNYKTGRLYDMAALTALTHAAGALMIWDLCHSAGILPIRLNACEADFAIGCGYKYLNGGPGAPAYVFVARRHVDHVRQPISGWHGHARPFAFQHDYEPHAGIDRMLAGTAPQLSLLALDTALDVFADIDMTAVRAKSMAMGDLFIRLLDQELEGFGFGLASPRESAERGSQVSLSHPQGYAIVQALIDRGVVGDFRAPDILRFGFAVLYVGYADIWRSVAILREVMRTSAWDNPAFTARKAVT